MKLNQIFQKPVDRAIEGVIKADDESGLKNEVEEYVLTNEVSKRLELFLEAYNNYQGANGAWISGFFGSGKSHLLKILALILENRAIDGIPIIDTFLPKCADNAILKASLQKAVRIPSRSMLFNIDQKADVISKTQIDALLSVFVKVFDEMCGYYGKQGYVAKFERDLEKRGIYQQFKANFEKASGQPWETGREQALLEGDNISQAYSQATGASAETVQNILDKYRAEYKVSIEDFAMQINEYIEQQSQGFRLNFFVDEVGQYIANNTKLMTNLQTIAESLATKCRGRAWIIVTAQDDMEDVIGELDEKKENDFTKIMARLSIRLKLTSKNVDEVIQKRLLLKAPASVGLLQAVYSQNEQNFGTLFDFTDGSVTYKNYKDQQHFVDSYPFVPYQFPLFQTSIKSLSEHSAFEGSYRSVGERSMLAVFQQVAMEIAGLEIGSLATFDLMFEGIRTALKGQFQAAILTAENHLNNPFAVQVLKALFLLKYVKGFKATPHNLAVLMIDSFDCDILKLRKRTEEALSLLEQQTYIQRNGDLYEFLTDDEKDVEEEIKNTEVDSDAVVNELGKILFDQIIHDRKITFDENNQDFSFSRKLDDHLLGKEYETAIHVITPFHENFDSEDTLKMHSMGRDELLIILPADERLVQDVLMLKRTEKYIQQSASAAQQESIRRILADKNIQNSERRRLLDTQIRGMVITAKMFIGGSEVEIASTDPLTLIVKAYQELVRRTYPNLKMLHKVNYSENDIEAYLHRDTGTLLENESQNLNEAEQEILAFIQANKSGGLRTTIKLLVEKFERKPYGWSLAAMQCNLALLSTHGKIEIRNEGNILEDAAFVKALKNTQAHAGVVIDPQVEFAASQVRRLKEFYEDFFDKPPQSTEARDLGKETAAALDERQKLLSQLFTNLSLYPFLAELSEPINLLKELTGKPYAFYLTDLPGKMDELLDLKEQTIAPILGFWNGSLKALFEEARRFYQEQSPNFDYLENGEPDQLKAILGEAGIFRGNRMQAAKSLMESLRQKVAAKLALEKEQACAAIRLQRERLAAMPEFGSLSRDRQNEINQSIEERLGQVESQNLIARIRDIHHSFEEVEYPQLLAKMTNCGCTTTINVGGETSGQGVHPYAEPKVFYISSRSIQVQFEKAWLADETDVDIYLKALREQLIKEIKKGRRIQI